MPRKSYKPEEIVAKLRQVDVLTSQGQSVAEAIRSIVVSEVTYYRWRQEFGGLKSGQVKRLKDLETENTRLRRAVSTYRHRDAVSPAPGTISGRPGGRPTLPFRRLSTSRARSRSHPSCRRVARLGRARVIEHGGRSEGQPFHGRLLEAAALLLFFGAAFLALAAIPPNAVALASKSLASAIQSLTTLPTTASLPARRW
jgi:hypothetical protein